MLKIFIIVFISVLILYSLKFKKLLLNDLVFFKKTKNIDYLITLIVIFSSVIFIISLVSVDHLIENPDIGDNGKVEYYGTIGDIVGGIINPAIAVPATLLTFLAFWVQYKANDEVRKQFEIQKFETEFNLKISLLRQEITEINLPRLAGKVNYEGREVMYQLDKELKFIYFIVKNTIYSNDLQKILEVSYYIFFKGRLLYFKNINQLSEKFNLTKKELLEIELILTDLYTFFEFGGTDGFSSLDPLDEEDIDVDEVAKLNKLLKEGFKINDFRANLGKIGTVYKTFTDQYSLIINHMPFKGHETRLSIFFRLIFSSVKFVCNQDILSYEQKRSYLRTLRSILTNYDQIHIFYNWYSKTASNWENGENKYLTDMRMIHNIPTDLIIEGLNLQLIFSNADFRYETGRKKTDSLFENLEIYSD